MSSPGIRKRFSAGFAVSLAWIVGVIGGLFAIIQSVREWINPAPVPPPPWVTSLYFLSLFFVVLYLMRKVHGDRLDFKTREGDLHGKINTLQKQLEDKERFIEGQVRQLANYEKVADLIHDILHYFRDSFIAIASSTEVAEMDKLFALFIRRFLNHYREIFINLTLTDDISTSFKLFIDEEHLITLARDDFSSRKRDDSDGVKTYHVKENSDFSKLFYLEQDCFIENDLETAGDGYKNERNHWSNYYKSAVVAPVRKQVADKEFDFMGFLCVDSTKKDVFQHSVSKAISLALSDLLYVITLLNKEAGEG